MKASITPARDAATVFLPDRIGIFPDRDLNVSLYRWLAAWFATVPATPRSRNLIRCGVIS